MSHGRISANHWEISPKTSDSGNQKTSATATSGINQGLSRSTTIGFQPIPLEIGWLPGFQWSDNACHLNIFTPAIDPSMIPWIYVQPIGPIAARVRNIPWGQQRRSSEVSPGRLSMLLPEISLRLCFDTNGFSVATQVAHIKTNKSCLQHVSIDMEDLEFINIRISNLYCKKQGGLYCLALLLCHITPRVRLHMLLAGQASSPSRQCIFSPTPGLYHFYVWHKQS